MVVKGCFFTDLNVVKVSHTIQYKYLQLGIYIHTPLGFGNKEKSEFIFSRGCSMLFTQYIQMVKNKKKTYIVFTVYHFLLYSDKIV